MHQAKRLGDRTGMRLNNLSSGAVFGLLPTLMSTEVRHERRVRELKEAGGDTFHSRANGETRPNGLMDYLDFHGLLPTPNAAEGEKYTTRYNPESQMGKELTSMAVNGLLPTPVASCQNTGCSKKQRNGRPRTSQLNHLFASRTGHASQLNPRYVREMMGFPPGWTELPFLAGERSQ